jgi:ABC-2 type transport system permease protein
VLIFIFGSIFGRPSSGPTGIKIGFVNNSDSKIAAKLESVLDTTAAFKLVKNYTDEKGNTVKFDSNSVKEYVRKGDAPAALVIPADAFTDTSTGFKLKFYYDPKNDIEMQVIEGLMTKNIMSQMPSLFLSSMQNRAKATLGKGIGQQFNRKIANVISEYYDVDTSKIMNWTKMDFADSMMSDSASKRSNFFTNLLQMDKVQLVGKDINNPNATRSVGGWAIMFLLFTITASSTSLFDDKKSGVVLRILSAPVSRVQILWSKYLYNISLGIIQLIVLFVMGYVFFDIDIFSNFFNLLLVIISAAAASTAFGMLLAAFSKTASQANGLGTFLILTMSAIGGAWFPTFILPPFIQVLSKGTLVYWSIEGFMDVLWRNSSTLDILPVVGILLGITAVVNFISVIQFKKGEVF